VGAEYSVSLPEPTIGGDLNVARVGFGAMRLTGHQVWAGPEEAARIGAAMAPMARQNDATIGQIALAWQLGRFPRSLPIPGTTRTTTSPTSPAWLPNSHRHDPVPGSCPPASGGTTESPWLR
jgi:aryl-alcohol dehydrogenase-like predicted oxidoreductase